MGSELTAEGAACKRAAAPLRTDLRERRAAPVGFVVGTAWSPGAWSGSGDDMVIVSLCSAKLFPILKLAHEPRVGPEPDRADVSCRGGVHVARDKQVRKGRASPKGW